MHSLRSRLLLSHTLPLLLITPLMGIVLVFVLETKLILVNLSRQMEGEALLIADIARDYPEMWRVPAQAQLFVYRFNPDVTAELTLLQPDGRLWSSPNPGDLSRQQKIVSHPGLPATGGVTATVVVSYSQDLDADVIAPVVGANGDVVGVIRLTRELASVYHRFERLRYLIAWVLLPGLLLGLLIGLTLAITLERPLEQLAQSIQQVTSEDELVTLPERGPQEVQLVVRSFNTLIERLHIVKVARRQLLTNLVHELARPLSALRAALHALQSGADADEKFRAYLLTGMVAELQGLQRLLDDLLQFYQGTVGMVQLNRRPTVLSEWLPICLSTWQQEAEQKGLVCQAMIPNNLSTPLIDPDRLSQALGNLLSNAIKYTPAGGTVSVVAEADEDEFRVSVNDTGPGIDPQEQERIFEPFYRMNSNLYSGHGLGLGLTIVRDIVAAHGGRVEVESTPGRGSQFTLRLPIN
ncbi:MAG: HAMP domain-containing histidine kinase [Caldilineaceae bacterium]|nr:HAMP domain-containing histidine kinase [Caldilineaceae bacterium]